MSTLSFWEREHLLEFDFTVIGSGIVGLTTAIHLRKKFKDSRVAIFEKGILPSGASTKNAGFACFGSPSELWSDLGNYSESEVLDLVAKRWEGLKKLREITGDENIDYENSGGFEIFPENKRFEEDKLDHLNGLLYPIFNQAVYQNSDASIDSFGFNKKNISGLVKNSLEGQLNTGKLIERLIQIAQKNNIKLFFGNSVDQIEDKGTFVELKCISNQAEVIFKSNRVAICTNGFTKKLLPDLAIRPVRGTVLVTKPIQNLKVKGAFHYDEGYFYFRNVGDRLLFGGGRNLDFKTEETTSLEINQTILERLKSDLEEFIVPNEKTEIDLVWSGIMGFSENKKPILKKYSGNIAIGVALGGMGVAIGSLVGEELAEHVMR